MLSVCCPFQTSIICFISSDLYITILFVYTCVYNGILHVYCPLLGLLRPAKLISSLHLLTSTCLSVLELVEGVDSRRESDFERTRDARRSDKSLSRGSGLRQMTTEELPPPQKAPTSFISSEQKNIYLLYFIYWIFLFVFFLVDVFLKPNSSSP